VTRVPATIQPVEPVASVVIATHERARMLPGLVRALEAQDIDQPFEVVIVDDGSRDQTWTVVQDLASRSGLDIRAVRLEENRGPASARNAGWRVARAPLVAFTDDDCLPQPGWLAALVSRLGDADLVEGRTEPHPDQRQHRSDLGHTIEVLEQGEHYQTCNMGYRRALLDRLGGFREEFRYPYGEDTDLAWRALKLGARAEYEPAALVFHEVARGGLRDHLRRIRREEGVVLLLRLHPEMRPQLLSAGVLYRDYHAAALLTAFGLLTARGWRRRPWRALAVVVPFALYVRRRTWYTRRRYKPVAVPLVLAADLYEVFVLARASVRHRTLVL